MAMKSAQVVCKTCRTPDPRRLQHHQRGLVTVEVAISILVVLIVILGSIDGARLMNAYSTVAYAAREGVRYAAVRGTEAGQDANRPSGDAPATALQIENYLRNFRAPHIPIRVTSVWPPDGIGGATKDAGAVLAVTVESDYVPVVPFINAITVSSTSRMVIFY